MADSSPADSKNLIATLARSGRMRIAAALAVVALVGGGLGVIMLRGDASGQKLLFSGPFVLLGDDDSVLDRCVHEATSLVIPTNRSDSTSPGFGNPTVERASTQSSHG